MEAAIDILHLMISLDQFKGQTRNAVLGNKNRRRDCTGCGAAAGVGTSSSMNMPMISPATAPARTALQALTLVVLTFLSHLLVMLNPGFFSHDEWQRADHVQAHGLNQYILEYGAVKAGPEFGFPVRPIGFVQEGISSLWMRDIPVIPHAIDVALHAAVVLLLWRLLIMAGMGNKRAILAGVIFAISPLATMSVGWVAASFDRWYVLFALICAHGVAIAARDGFGAKAVALVLLGSAGAILSKETAIALPIALTVMCLALYSTRRSDVRWPSTFAAVFLSALPIFGYLLIRWPAILATMAGPDGPYSPSLGNVGGNALLYFAYPFALQAVEVVSMSQLPKWQLWLAVALHGGMLLWLWQRSGWRLMLAYGAGYFVFLLPVLPLPSQGAHYLYAAGIPFSIAIATLLSRAENGEILKRFPSANLLIATMLCAFFLGRSIFIQENLYSHGKCQAELLSSFDPQADAALRLGAKRLRIIASPGAREYVALGALFGRTSYVEGGGRPTVVGATVPPMDGDKVFIMAVDCSVSAAE